MKLLGVLNALAVSILPALSAGQALAGQGADADWPCIQRKVPVLSFGQIWTGPELPPAASGWEKAPGVSALVRETAARRKPIADAQTEIMNFAKDLPAGGRNDGLAMLAQGLFEHMSAERAEVMSGIARYARNQLETAARLRAESAGLAALRAKPDADPNEIAARTERMTIETRIFEERVQSLTYVCEIPTLIEQRLYALSATVAKAMVNN